MESTQYFVVFKGEIAQGQHRDVVRANLSSMSKLTTQQIEESLWGKPLVIKDHIDYQTALTYKAAFEQAGTVCHIQLMKKTVPQKRSHKKPRRQPKKNIQHAPPAMQYNLVFSGNITPGHQIEDVKKRVAALCKIPMTQCDVIFTGKVVTIKTNLDKVAAGQYKHAFETTGAICRIEKITPTPQRHASP